MPDPLKMAGYPGHNDFDDGYRHQGGNGDLYYQDDQQYYDQGGFDGHAQGAHAGGYEGHPQQGGDGYYDESYVS